MIDAMRLTVLLYSILVLMFLLLSIIPVEADGGANQHFEAEGPDATLEQELHREWQASWILSHWVFGFQLAVLLGPMGP